MTTTLDDLDVIPGASWQPVDLGPILRGEYRRPEPAIGLDRSDGLRLLYPGKEHAVVGEMETGKSWFALACAAVELKAGHHVVYVHFEEADAVDTVERLQALDVPGGAILDQLRFVGPGEPVNAEWLGALLNPAPSLVLLDGVNEGMALHEQRIREEDGAAAFRRRLVKPCTAAGAAVLSADHVVKDREKRDRYGLGSIHKGNALTGALIVLENVEPFGRGRKGCSHVFVTKDRPGHLRRHGKPTKLPGKTYMGSLVVDDERTWKDYLELYFAKPTDASGSGGEVRDKQAEADEHVLAVVCELTEAGNEANTRTVRAKTRLGNGPTLEALDRLVLDKKLTESSGSRGARIFTLAESEVGP